MQSQHQFIHIYPISHRLPHSEESGEVKNLRRLLLDATSRDSRQRFNAPTQNCYKLRSYTPRTISGARPQQISRHSPLFSLAVPSCRSVTSVASDSHHDKSISFPPTATEKHYNDGRIEIYIIHSLPLTVLNSYTLTYLLKPFA